MKTRAKGSDQDTPATHPMILILDQNIELLMNLAPALRKTLGFEYHFKMTFRPEQALHYAVGSYPVLLIADLRLLLKSDPMLFLQALREHAPQIRVILGSPANLHPQLTDRFQADAIIEHPFDLEGLVLLTKEHLHGKKPMR